MKIIKDKQLFIILIIYIFITLYCEINYAKIYNNVINPIFWLGILIYLFWNINKNYIRFHINKKHFIYMSIISLAHIIFYFYLGFIFGFCKSPYNHNIMTIIKNIIVRLLPIIGIELIRNVLVIRNKNNKIALIITTILLIALEINYYTLLNLYENKEECFKYICKIVVPLCARNVLYIYLIANKFYLLSLIYRIPEELAFIISPILPNLDWFVNGSVEIVLVFVIYVLFKYNFIIPNNIRKRKNRIEKRTYLITIILSIILICFMLGVFQYEPIWILSNSMAPIFERGDVVIFKKLGESGVKEIHKDSIIIYEIEEQNIAHRIVDIIDENNTVLYRTKGDSNNAPDTKLVKIEQIKGTYLFHIKYIGFPSVWLYEYFNNESDKVKTK